MSPIFGVWYNFEEIAPCARTVELKKNMLNSKETERQKDDGGKREPDVENDDDPEPKKQRNGSMDDVPAKNPVRPKPGREGGGNLLKVVPYTKNG